MKFTTTTNTLFLLLASSSTIINAFIPVTPATQRSTTTAAVMRMTSTDSDSTVDYNRASKVTTPISSDFIESMSELTDEQQHEKILSILNQQKQVKEAKVIKTTTDSASGEVEESVLEIQYVQRPPIAVVDDNTQKKFDKAVDKQAEKIVASAITEDTKKELKKLAEKVEGKTKDDGLFAPAVLLSKDVFGKQELNTLRAKIIKEHAEVIGKFTNTADSKFGDSVLKLLFEWADKDNNGTIDEKELQRAFHALGCGFIPDKQINGMFKRADKDKNEDLDYQEWCVAAPKTLKTALVKLAKKNGHDLGFLA